MREAILKKDQEERFNMKRAWFVNAYRLIGVTSHMDLVQPWFRTKADAREYAKHAGITIIKEES